MTEYCYAESMCAAAISSVKLLWAARGRGNAGMRNARELERAKRESKNPEREAFSTIYIMAACGADSVK